MRHGSLIPLLGGNVLGAAKATGKLPEVMLSYKAFAVNDANIRAYWPDVPFHLLDEEPDVSKYKNLDLFTVLPPCAGLSTAAGGSSPEKRASNNSWMYKSMELLTQELQPKVIMIENAPTLFTERGKLVREDLTDIANKAGYSFSLYATNTKYHGIPQSRQRTFAFAWKNSDAPVFKSYRREHLSLENYLSQVKNTPEELAQAVSNFEKDIEVQFIKAKGGFGVVKEWMKTKKDPTKVSILEYLRATNQLEDFTVFAFENGTERQGASAMRRQEKIDNGKSIFSDSKSIFQGIMPTLYWRTSSAIHPTEDRCLTTREMMWMMGIPDDFQMANKNLNAICQNVPVCTASDMATEVLGFLAGERESSGQQFFMQSNLI